jgi:hypothetical protein
MTDAAPLSWQPSLLAGDAEPAIDPAFARLTRIQLVTGGSCQRTWQHTVPKVAKAGPRISITFRHGA